MAHRTRRCPRPDFVVDVVATTLGVRDYTGRPPRDSLVEAMAEGARLLVLDNCEQVVDAVAELVQTLLERCAGLHVLTTSRELLGTRLRDRHSGVPLTTPSRDRSQPVIKGPGSTPSPCSPNGPPPRCRGSH
ncbi:hypothetical protein GS444_21730 [Rhodococcus hoagii]|nr:hypothetical protein [Prescottella equi]